MSSCVTVENTQANANVPELQLSCSICYETFRPRMITISSRCGHVYCSECFTNIGPNCAYCRKDLDKPTAPIRVRFRFNKMKNPMCRLCKTFFNEDIEMWPLRCGDIFCVYCLRRIVRTGGKCPYCKLSIHNGINYLHHHIVSDTQYNAQLHNHYYYRIHPNFSDA